MHQGWAHSHFWPLPPGRFFDRVFAFAKFLKDHGRLPTRKLSFNDVLYHQKIAADFPTPVQVETADKEQAKDYVALRVGREHTVPTLAVLRTPDEVMTFDFPEVCVAKATHASGKFYIRHQGDPIAREMIASWLNDNFYMRSREAQYRPLERKIIVEPLAFGKKDPEDYRFFCYRGEIRAILHEPFHSKALGMFYTPDWEPLHCSVGVDTLDTPWPRPDCLEAMSRDVEILAKDFHFVRIDAFCDGQNYMFGELTHVHGNAAEQFFPPESEQSMSRRIFEKDLS